MHQKITHTSRFDYVTASVIEEYNLRKNKPHDTLNLGGRRSYRQICFRQLHIPLTSPAKVTYSLAWHCSLFPCSGEPKLLSEHELSIPTRRQPLHALPKDKLELHVYLIFSDMDICGCIIIYSIYVRRDFIKAQNSFSLSSSSYIS